MFGDTDTVSNNQRNNRAPMAEEARCTGNAAGIPRIRLVDGWTRRRHGFIHFVCSFVAQGHDRVDARGSTRGDVAGQKRRESNQQSPSQENGNALVERNHLRLIAG